MTDNHVLPAQDIAATVTRIVASTPVVDVHTHLYPPAFGTSAGGVGGPSDPAGLMLWGIDELLTYHYLVAEVFRVVPATTLPYERFWAMPKSAQADHIWKNLFQNRSPISEACRGVLTTLARLGLDAGDRDLSAIRRWFAVQDPNRHIDRVMEVAGVESITMTNAVFDDNERSRWLNDPAALIDSRFRAALRIDPILRDWPQAAARLSAWGYPADVDISHTAIEQGRRFLRDWVDRQKAIYLAVSLPPEFRYPADPADALARSGQKAMEKIVLPVCEERGLPFAMMIGSRLRVNPALRDAGDMSGKADVLSVANLCRDYPNNRFLVTMLSRENQHELCVTARKFGNLMIFGCWWFLNNPSLIREIERMRFELLGESFIPQHSDARVLDQLVYKWDHSRRVIAEVLAEKYQDLVETGWRLTPQDIKRDVRLLFRDNFAAFLQG